LTPEDCIKMMERAEKVGAYLTSVFGVPVEAVLLNEGETWEAARLRCVEARVRRLQKERDAEEGRNTRLVRAVKSKPKANAQTRLL
jgi:hypothetical protein